MGRHRLVSTFRSARCPCAMRPKLCGCKLCCCGHARNQFFSQCLGTCFAAGCGHFDAMFSAAVAIKTVPVLGAAAGATVADESMIWGCCTTAAFVVVLMAAQLLVSMVVAMMMLMMVLMMMGCEGCKNANTQRDTSAEIVFARNHLLNTRYQSQTRRVCYHTSIAGRIPYIQSVSPRVQLRKSNIHSKQ